MLDTRQYDRSITDLYWNTHYIHEISNDASRSMMGSRQENWFYQTLIDSKERGATWRIIGSQTVFSRINASSAYGNVDPFNYDQWDGYLANRNRTYKTLYDNNITNNIMISGDSHANWVSDLIWLGEHPYDAITGEGAIGVEFGGSAVSSPSPAGQNVSIATSKTLSQALVQSNPELQWQEFYYRGYFELHLSHEKVDAKFFGLPTLINRNPNEISLANFTVYAGENHLHRYNGSVVPGGAVENGYIKLGKTVQTNITNSTETGLYFISHEDVEDL